MHLRGLSDSLAFWHTHTHTHTHAHTKQTHTFIYLIPGAEYPSWEHEQVTHGDKTGPYKEWKEAEHPLKDRLNADEDEDGQEKEESSGNCDQERQVVLCILGGKRQREIGLLVYTISGLVS